ncbi:MAG: M48 family metalloprotease [Parcubacteria group bacterium]|nr:M48 family metalloprotease [Parcubacteria group bacterium]
MRICIVVLLPFILFATSVFGQIPVKNPISTEEWEVYTKNLFVKLTEGTQYEELANQITVEININDTPNAGSWASDKRMYVNTGRIKLVENEAEYISVIIHEFGHIVLDHRSAESVVPAGGDGGRPDFNIDLSLWEKQETDTDAFVSKILKQNGYDTCAQYQGFEKVLNVKGYKFNKKPTPFQQVFVRRLEIMKGFCIKMDLCDFIAWTG